MFYISIFGIILVGYLLSLCRLPKLHINMYAVIVLILSIILAFRYGQGSDYFAYKRIYESCSTFEEALYNPYKVHGETGFRLLCYCFRGKFERFVVFVSFFEMWMLCRGINRFSRNKWLSLCIFFPTGYMTYYFSALRQGITIAVFVGYLLGCIEDKKWDKYYISVLILCTIHSAAFILLIMPLILKFSQKNVLLLTALLGMSGILFYLPFVKTLLSSLPYLGGKLESSFDHGINILAMVERVGYLCLMLMLLFHINKNIVSKEIKDFVKLYCFGVGIYFFFSFSAGISSRVMIYFKILEIFIMPCLLSFHGRWRQMVNIACVSLMTIMLVKNINSYLGQGSYYSDVSTLQYPYISIYNKEKIMKYRPFPQYVDNNKEMQDW